MDDFLINPGPLCRFPISQIPSDEKKDNGAKPLVGILKNGSVTAASEKPPPVAATPVESPTQSNGTAETGGIRGKYAEVFLVRCCKRA